MDKKNIKAYTKLNHKITPEGSLGLLALGDIGLRAWREEKQKNRDEAK